MNLQEFKNQHKNFGIHPSKKLFFDKYAVKVKIRWDGCTFLNGRANRYGSRRVPDWVKNKLSVRGETPSSIKLQGRMIKITPSKFHAMYNFLQEFPPPHSRFDDSYDKGCMHFYFSNLDEAHNWILKMPEMDYQEIDVYAPFQELSAGEIVTNPKVTKAGYKYRINFKPFVVEKNEISNYATIFKNLENEVKIPNSFHHVLFDEWFGNRKVWYLSNKYVYTKDQSTMTYLTLVWPQLIHSVQDLVSKKEISWQK